MSIFHNPALLGAGGQSTGYNISRSLRFNSSDSAYLSRTPASAGNRKTWTWAGWVKRSELSSSGVYPLMTSYVDTQNYSVIDFQNDTLRVVTGTTGVGEQGKKTTQIFRDPSSWYHIVIASDNLSTLKIYVNGSEVTAFSTNATVTADWYFNTTNPQWIGREQYSTSNNYFSGYLADIHFIDGQALDPTSFTEVSATTGQLIPKAYTGSFGTNGFWLKFSDNSAATATTLGKDYSGNSNNWTPNNLSVLDGITAGTGALPIYNTTSNNYLTKSTGTRTDSFSSSIALAVAMDGANGGTTFTDESATIKGSGSAKSLTVTGATTSTAFSKFYGSSGFFGTGGSTPNISISPVNSFASSNFTIELWYYATASENDRILYRSVNGSQYGILLYMNGGVIQVYLSSNGSSWDLASGTSIGSVTANQWTHIALVRNGSSFTGYMNGSSTSVVTSSASIISAVTEQIGGNGSLSFPGYIQDVRVYIGAAKYTSTFTVPSYSVSTAAGNDSLVDTPTSYGTDTGAGGEVRGNYATLNPIYNAPLLNNGNLQVTGASNAFSTIYASSGKWYAEFTMLATPGSNWALCGISIDATTASSGWRVFRSSDGQYYNGSSYSTYGSSWTTNDVIGVAVDIDNSTLEFFKNGSSQGQKTGLALSGKDIAFLCSPTGSGAGELAVNFGQRPFAYTAPSGFKALCDTNLPTPVVAKPSGSFDIALYTGNSGTQSITLPGGMSPDLVWVKTRSAATYYHALYDIVRGTGPSKSLYSNATDAEGAQSIYTNLTSFDSSGFSLGSTSPNNNILNQSGQTFVAWCWDAGSSTVSNTQGSITSSVRANASAGFSIVTYSFGNAPTVGHGLGVAPSLIIAKSRTVGYDWVVYHRSLGRNAPLVLNDTAAAYSIANYWGSSEPSSTVFGTYGTGGNSNNAGDMVAYCWAPVAGYSSFGSYTGNGSADGPFVFTGFRPAFVMLKTSSAAGDDWYLYDYKREAEYNPTTKPLFPNGSYAEQPDSRPVDLLNNGFKIRNQYWFNANGATVIYCAFAESPFQYARAR